jgi:hypothetical protein
MDGPKVPTAVHGHLATKYYPKWEENVIADYLKITFTPHNLCDENHERQLEIRVQALLETADDTPLEKGRLFDIQRSLISSNIEIPHNDTQQDACNKGKFIEIEKGLWTRRYSKEMPQAHSKKTTGYV